LKSVIRFRLISILSFNALAVNPKSSLE
jgi:hypothetical protein